jgi:DNA polymerase III delta subunit
LAHVDALFPPTPRETAFEILDLAASGKVARAMEALRQGVRLGRISLDQFLGAFGWYARRAWEVRQRGGWIPSSEPAGRRQALGRLSRWPEPRLRALLAETLKADLALKLGYPDSELLAGRLLVQLSG